MAVLIVEDSEVELARLTDVVERVSPKAKVLHARGLREAMSVVLRAEEIEAALLDVQLPGGYATDLLPVLRERFPQCLPVLMTRHTTLLRGCLDTAIVAEVAMLSGKHIGSRRFRQYLGMLEQFRKRGERATMVFLDGEPLEEANALRARMLGADDLTLHDLVGHFWEISSWLRLSPLLRRTVFFAMPFPDSDELANILGISTTQLADRMRRARKSLTGAVGRFGPSPGHAGTTSLLLAPLARALHSKNEQLLASEAAELAGLGEWPEVRGADERAERDRLFAEARTRNIMQRMMLLDDDN